jgi:flagellar capping protein FliD
MAISTTSTSNLDTYYQQIIANQIAIEKKPIDTIQTKVDTLTVQKGMYNDLTSKFDSLQSSVKALLSSDAFYALKPGRTTSISTSSTQDVISATAGSAAIVGNYAVNITQLATSQKARSDQQTYSDQDLNLSGTFLLGGSQTRSIDSVSSNINVTDIAVSDALIEDTQELGNSSYFIETRKSESGVWQFRLVDENGVAQNIRKNTATDDTLTTAWQNIPVGEEYDTGRGLKFSFGANSDLYTVNNKATGAASLEYTAKGVSISVSTTDSLEDIASLINNADYAQGNEVHATIVDKQLIIQTKNTGSTKQIYAEDSGTDTVLQSLGFLTATGDYKNYSAETDASRDSIFSVNGLSVTRASNTSITDVITGVSLNLEPDSEGSSATLKVTADSAEPLSAINTFISSFNSVADYVSEKIATVKNEDETYTRGGLAGDSTFRLFNSSMYSVMSAKYENDGDYQYLFELGLEFNDDNQLAIVDSDLLNDALNNNFDDVELFFEKIMGAMNTKVGVFTGSTGYVNTALKTNENQTSYYEDRITSMEERLELRRTQLTNQYLTMQLELEALTSTSNSLSAGFTYSS